MHVLLRAGSLPVRMASEPAGDLAVLHARRLACRRARRPASVHAFL